jgi:hypothetical protein
MSGASLPSSVAENLAYSFSSKVVGRCSPCTIKSEYLFFMPSLVISIIQLKPQPTSQRSSPHQLIKHKSTHQKSRSRMYEIGHEFISHSRIRHSSWLWSINVLQLLLVFSPCIHPVKASGSGEWYHECHDGSCGYGSATKSSSCSPLCRDTHELCAKYARMGTRDAS